MHLQLSACRQKHTATCTRMQAAQEVGRADETCKAVSVPISASSPQVTRSALANSFLPGQLGRASVRACLRAHELVKSMGKVRV